MAKKKAAKKKAAKKKKVAKRKGAKKKAAKKKKVAKEERRQEALIRAANRFPGCSPTGGHPDFFKEFRATGHGYSGRGCRDVHVEYQQVGGGPCCGCSPGDRESKRRG